MSSACSSPGAHTLHSHVYTHLHMSMHISVQMSTCSHTSLFGTVTASIAMSRLPVLLPHTIVTCSRPQLVLMNSRRPQFGWHATTFMNQQASDEAKREGKGEVSATKLLTHAAVQQAPILMLMWRREPRAMNALLHSETLLPVSQSTPTRVQSIH